MSIKFNSTSGILKFTNTSGTIKFNESIAITSIEYFIMNNNTWYYLPTTTTLSTSDIKNIKVDIFNEIVRRSTNGNVITPTAFNTVYQCYFFFAGQVWIRMETEFTSTQINIRMTGWLEGMFTGNEDPTALTYQTNSNIDCYGVYLGN